MVDKFKKLIQMNTNFIPLVNETPILHYNHINKSDFDILWNLISLFSGDIEMDFTILEPSTHGLQNYNVILSWPLAFCLLTGYKLGHFGDFLSVRYQFLLEQMDILHLKFAEQLESNGLYYLSCKVLSMLNNKSNI